MINTVHIYTSLKPRRALHRVYRITCNFSHQTSQSVLKHMVAALLTKQLDVPKHSHYTMLYSGECILRDVLLSHALAGAATDVCFSPSNNMLMISVGMDAKIKCYDIQTRK